MAKENTLSGNELNKVNETAKANNSESQRKRKSIPPMWRVLGKARKVFDAQLSKTNDVKLQCIEMFMNAEMPDKEKFWSDFMEQVDKLFNSRKYIKECQELGVAPENISEHIIFLGSAEINKVLKSGIKDTIGNDYKLYSERLSPESTNMYRDELVDSLK